MCALAIEKRIEELVIDFKNPDLCTYYRICSKRNCNCEKYLAQKDDPSLWDSRLLLFYHPEYILTNELPTVSEIINPPF